MRQSRLILMALASMVFSGCAMNNWLFPPAPFSDRSPCALPPGASKEHIVQHINRNIQGTVANSGLASWMSSNVKLSLGGMPVTLPAQIAVESPRNFRLRVSAPIGGAELVDMGSNPEQFWFWVKDSPHRHVIVASHDDLPIAQQQMNIPFHPDWLMEVMGVIPIDSSNVKLNRSNPESPLVDLVSEHPSPSGEKVRKVIRVNSCHGIVVEHALYDSRNMLIASARLGNHRKDDKTGIITPRIIRLDWPEMRQQLTMEFADMQINPTHGMSETFWELPEKPNYPPLNLTTLLNNPHGAGFSPFGVAPTGGVSGPPSDNIDPFWSDGSTSPPASTPLTKPMSASERPSVYSQEASQSSSAPPPRARGLWRWPWSRRK